MYDSYIDCIKKLIVNNLGQEFLDLIDERALSIVMKEDMERLVNNFGMSKQDAAVVAVVNFRQDIKIHTLKVRPEGDDTLDERYLDELDIKILSNLSKEALEQAPFSDEFKRKIHSARKRQMNTQETYANATPRQSVEYLAEKAYEFFEQEYYASDEIHSIIETYTTLLARAQMARFHYQDNTDEVINKVIKPMYLYYDKLGAWMFNTIQSSLTEKYPTKSYYARQAYKLFDDDNSAMDAICKELSNKLRSIFVIELWHSIKKHYEKVLQNYYPTEYKFFTNDKDGMEGLWDELYGRSVQVVFDSLKSLGLNISLIDKDKIIYNKVVVSSDGTTPINIIKNIIFGDIDVTVK